MEQFLMKDFEEIRLVAVVNNKVFNTLFISLSFVLIAWYIQYHWKRRKLYIAASKTNGPLPLPFIGNALYFAGSSSDTFYNILHITSTYKSPVRIWLGQKLIFAVSKPQQLQIVLGRALEKDDLYRFAKTFTGNSVFTANVPRWRRHKKIIMPTFNQKILDSFVNIFAEKSEILIKQMRKIAGKGIVDIFPYVSRCTTDIICETAMGTTVNAQTTDCDYVKWVNRTMEIAFTRMTTVWYQYDFIFKRTSLAKEDSEILKKMRGFSESVVKQKRNAYQKNITSPRKKTQHEKTNGKSFLQHLIEIADNGENFTDEELREEVDTFMVAGSETSGSTSSFLFIMLGMFPEIQNKVYEEVISTVGPDRSIDSRDLERLVYLEMVIKETLRLFPIGPLSVRAVTADIMLDNCTLPKGSSVAIATIRVHRDPEVWPNPLKFNPDRFLPEEVAKRHPYSWIPFLSGYRYCIGSRYAMMAMKTLIATVIRNYYISTEYKKIEDIKLKIDVVLKPVNGYKVSLEFRK